MSALRRALPTMRTAGVRHWPPCGARERRGAPRAASRTSQMDLPLHEPRLRQRGAQGERLQLHQREVGVSLAHAIDVAVRFGAREGRGHRSGVLSHRRRTAAWKARSTARTARYRRDRCVPRHMIRSHTHGVWSSMSRARGRLRRSPPAVCPALATATPAHDGDRWYRTSVRFGPSPPAETVAWCQRRAARSSERRAHRAGAGSAARDRACSPPNALTDPLPSNWIAYTAHDPRGSASSKKNETCACAIHRERATWNRQRRETARLLRDHPCLRATIAREIRHASRDAATCRGGSATVFTSRHPRWRPRALRPRVEHVSHDPEQLVRVERLVEQLALSSRPCAVSASPT